MQASLSRLLLLRHLHVRFTAPNEQTESLSVEYEWTAEFCSTLQITFWSTRSTSPAQGSCASFFGDSGPHAIILRCSLDAVLVGSIFVATNNLLKYRHTICSSESSTYEIDKRSVL
jgi:hypothetical protein